MQAGAGRQSAAIDSLEQALASFEQAQSLAGTERPAVAVEAGMGAIAVELRLGFTQKKPPKLETGRLIELSRTLESRPGGPDWDLQALRIELKLFRALARGSLESDSADLLLQLDEVATASWPAARIVSTGRFVLAPYRDMVGGAEAEVAGLLLGKLDTFVEADRDS